MFPLEKTTNALDTALALPKITRAEQCKLLRNAIIHTLEYGTVPPPNPKKRKREMDPEEKERRQAKRQKRIEKKRIKREKIAEESSASTTTKKTKPRKPKPRGKPLNSKNFLKFNTDSLAFAMI